MGFCSYDFKIYRFGMFCLMCIGFWAHEVLFFGQITLFLATIEETIKYKTNQSNEEPLWKNRVWPSKWLTNDWQAFDLRKTFLKGCRSIESRYLCLNLCLKCEISSLAVSTYSDFQKILSDFKCLIVVYQAIYLVKRVFFHKGNQTNKKEEKKLNTRISDQTSKQTKTDQNNAKNDIIVKSTILNGVCVSVSVCVRYILQLEGKSICI